MKTSRKGAKAQRAEYLVEIGDDGGQFCSTPQEALLLWDEDRKIAGDNPVLAYRVTPVTRRDLYADLADQRVGSLTPAGRAAVADLWRRRAT